MTAGISPNSSAAWCRCPDSIQARPLWSVCPAAASPVPRMPTSPSAGCPRTSFAPLPDTRAATLRLGAAVSHQPAAASRSHGAELAGDVDGLAAPGHLELAHDVGDVELG